MTPADLLRVLTVPACWLGNETLYTPDWVHQIGELSADELDPYRTCGTHVSPWGTLQSAPLADGVLVQLVRPSRATPLEMAGQALFDVVTDGLFLYDDAYELVDLNEAASRLHGWPREQMLAMHPSQFIHPSAHHVFADFIDTLRTQPIFHGFARGLRADGSSFDVAVTGVAVPVGDQRYYLSSIRDITDRLRLQESLERTRRFDALGRMAGGIAHDLNNLLTVQLSSLDHAREQLPADAHAVREALSDLHQAVTATEQLTQRLLLFSQHRVLRSEPTDLAAQLDDLQADLHHRLVPGMTLTVHSDADAGRATLHPGTLRAVLVELLDNAVEAMAPDGRVEIRLESVHDHGPFVQLTVRDDGRGMASELAAHATEPFVTTHDDRGAQGLGLATVHGLVHQHGGVLQLHSEPEEGTEVRIRWPRLSSPYPPRTATPAPVPSRQPRARVLVVEDQHVVRRGLTRVLERAGFSVVAAEGLLEAREALDTHAVDLLVTDLRLLDGTGFQVTDEARQLTPGLPVLWISGHPPAATERPADVQFLEKPFTAVQILDAVRQTLGISAPAS